jgi:GTPase Era involved in 16S rRNA processing
MQTLGPPPPARDVGAQGRLGRKVHLFLHVKVKPDWGDDRGLYREIGLDWVE